MRSWMTVQPPRSVSMSQYACSGESRDTLQSRVMRAGSGWAARCVSPWAGQLSMGAAWVLELAEGLASMCCAQCLAGGGSLLPPWPWAGAGAWRSRVGVSLKSILSPRLKACASPAFTRQLLPSPLLQSPRHHSTHSQMGWGALPRREGLGCAAQRGYPLWSGARMHWVALGGPGGQQHPRVLRWEPSPGRAHLFGLAEVGDVEGVDTAGVDARPAHLSAVLEELLLPGQWGCGRGDGETAETPPVPQPCLVLLLFPSPFGCFCAYGLFFFLLRRLPRAG